MTSRSFSTCLTNTNPGERRIIDMPRAERGRDVCSVLNVSCNLTWLAVVYLSNQTSWSRSASCCIRRLCPDSCWRTSSRTRTPCLCSALTTSYRWENTHLHILCSQRGLWDIVSGKTLFTHNFLVWKPQLKSWSPLSCSVAEVSRVEIKKQP